MSFQIGLSDRSKISARFIRKVHREIQRAFSRRADEGMTQQQLANKLEVNRATVNKRLLGHDNLTLRSIADFAWALDVDLTFQMTPKSRPARTNVYKAMPPVAVSPAVPKSLTQAPPVTAAGTFIIKSAENHVHG